MQEILVQSSTALLLLFSMALVIGWSKGGESKTRFMATIGRGVMTVLALMVVPVLAISAASAL